MAAAMPGVWSEKPTGNPNKDLIDAIARRFASAGSAGYSLTHCKRTSRMLPDRAMVSTAASTSWSVAMPVERMTGLPFPAT